MLPRRTTRRAGRAGSVAALCVLLVAPGLPGLETGGPPSSPGAALRAAIALEAESPADAARRFAEIARKVPLVADYAMRLQIRALLDAQRLDDAVTVGSGFLQQFPDSPLRGQVERTLAAALAQRGDEADARALWRQALAAAPSADDRTALLADIAASQERSGDPTGAAHTWLEIWKDAPASDYGDQAEAALDRLEAAGAPHLRSAAAWAERSEALYQANWNTEALTACDQALSGTLPRRERREVARRRARLLFRMRRYPEAARAFQALGRDREARYWRARALARAGEVDRAIAAFEALGRNPRRALDARALYLASTLLQDKHPGRALRLLHRVARFAPEASLRRTVRWQLGWSSFQKRDFGEAAREFARLSRDEPNALDRLRSQYWLGRSLLAQGHGRGEQDLASLAADYPFTYYGWRAATRVGVSSPPDEEQPEPALDGDGVEQPVATIPARSLERIRILIEAGLDDDARREIESLAGDADPSQSLVLGRLYQDAGAFHEAQLLALNGRRAELAAGPRPAALDWWWLAWPDAWSGVVEDAATRHGIEPALLYAIMREESGYRPQVVSVAGARGLTQIMPSTGERLARDLALDGFDPQQLFDPERNLDLGAAYLSQLMKRFDGRLSAVIASYNAGPVAVQRWLGGDAPQEDDAWVESIPYTQTRSYVKRVLRSVYAYRVLYQP